MLRFQIFLFDSLVEVRVYQPPVFDGEAENGLQCFPQLALRVGELSFIPFLQVYDVERNNLELLLRSFHPFFVIHILRYFDIKRKTPIRVFKVLSAKPCGHYCYRVRRSR